MAKSKCSMPAMMQQNVRAFQLAGALLLFFLPASGQSWEMSRLTQPQNVIQLGQLQSAARSISSEATPSALSAVSPPSAGPVPYQAPRVRLRITASHLPISVLRSITREKPPEGAGLYAARVCNLSSEPLSIEAGQIEQAFEAHVCAAAGQPLRDCGMAMVGEELAMQAIRRGRSKSWGIAAKGAEFSAVGGAVTSGLKITGAAAHLSGWIPIALAGVGLGFELVKSFTDQARAEIDAPVRMPWLSAAGRIALDAGACSPRLLAMGSYRRGQAETVVIEAE